MVAFLANYFSPMIPVKAFALFAGIAMPVNYLLVVMIFPPAVIVYEEHIKLKCVCWGHACTTEVGGLSGTEYLFDMKVNDCVKKGRFIIIGVSLIWFVISAYFTSQMGPLTK